MAMLPVLLDMVDEIYSSLENQSKTFPDSIPLLFVPQRAPEGCGQQGMKFRRGCQKGNWGRPAGCARRCPRGDCAQKPAGEEFKTTIDVQSYKPEEIEVKVKDREILVAGKHEERPDELGFISRQFSRRFVLPQEFDPDTVSTFVTADGKMTIKATKPQPAAVETNERIIPIQRVPSDATTESPPQDQEWEKVDEAAGENSKTEAETPKE